MKVSFLHTLANNQILFNKYIDKFKLEDCTKQISHHVKEQLLKDAQDPSVDNETIVKQSVHDAINSIFDDNENENPDIIVCTCSSIGVMAEEYSSSIKTTTAQILRVDRAMCEKAAAEQAAHSIHVLAAVESTLQPTKSLLEECIDNFADSQQQNNNSNNISNKNIELTVIPNVWKEFYQKGDVDGYAQGIAKHILETYGRGEDNEQNLNIVVVLAQASMAPAIDYLSKQQLSTLPKILSSPEICMERLLEQQISKK